MFIFIFVLAASLPLLNGFQLPGLFRSSTMARNIAAGMSGFELDVIAPGTPFERPKIGNSVVDLIGGTPMVQQRSYDTEPILCEAHRKLLCAL